TEYLALAKIGNRKAELAICMYEALAARPMSEDGEWDPVIPNKIDGKEVVGVDDEWIIGGELSCLDGRYFHFEQREVYKAVDWLAENHWPLTNGILTKVWRAVGLSPPSR